MASNSGSSVLGTMVAGVMAAKTKAATPAATLSPVGAGTSILTQPKAAPLDGKHDVMFPFDDPQTINRAILDGLKAVEVAYQHLAHVRDGLIALAGLYGTPVEGEETIRAVEAQAEKEQRAKEAMADARAREKAAREAPKPPETTEEFQADFAKKQAEVQAAVFGNPVPRPAPEPIPVETDEDDDDEDEEPEPAGWACPVHKKAVTKRSARRGVDYRACPECDQFERV